MKPQNAVIALVALVVVVVIWVTLLRKPSVSMKHLGQGTPAPTAKEQAKQTPAPTRDALPTPITNTAAHQSPGGPYAPADPRWAERTRKLKEDRQYEWRTPIAFYGKVVDQDGNPLERATIDVIWTDMSPDGSSQRQIISDGAGLFSVTGISGKHMTVQVAKEGYLREASKGRSAFEFAGFWEPTYYDPDPNNPVIFYMRKKGEPAPLVSSDGKIVVTFGMPSSIPLPPVSNGSSRVKVTVFQNDAKMRNWKAQVSIEGGGITPALEEFPFEAPKEGYQAAISLNEESPRPPGWQDMDVGGRFYIKTDKGYGLLKLRQIRGKKTLHYKVLLNSDGGTNLEPDHP